MINAQLLDQDDKSIRTQITLTEKLKARIQQNARKKNQSLSEYLRRAALLQLKVDQKDKESLEEVANKVFGSLDLKKHPEWSTMNKVIKWQKAMRAEWD